MIISKINIKGFKSFGNNIQTIELDPNSGKLILLTGSNGNGKSSFIESFEYLVYGKVKSTRGKKWQKLSNLPNRINNSMELSMDLSADSKNITIERGINPTFTRLIENGVEVDQMGKDNIDSRIEKYAGMDIETFKSFISMNISDFKNFLSLKTEEKKNLLDKLFNLEVINQLNDILKDIVRENKKQIISIDSEINTYNDTINRIKDSINKIKIKVHDDFSTQIDELVILMSDKKSEFVTLKEKIAKIKEKEELLTTESNNESKQLMQVQLEVRKIQGEIDLYNKGKCPTCSTDFDSTHFITLKSTLLEKKEATESIVASINDKISHLNEKRARLKTIASEANTAWDELNYFLRSTKSKIEELKFKQSNASDSESSTSIVEFENTLLDLESKLNTSKDSSIIYKEKEDIYKELNYILGENGVRKSIIASIVKPLNHFIAENLSIMGVPFEVELDDTFTARVQGIFSEIDHETMSTGEDKKVNMAILVAYLKMIRMKKKVNILFLDEVFASIDLEGVDNILMLLKDFANEYNVNIFAVHHAILNEELFDRIIRVNKEVFTYLEEVTE